MSSIISAIREPVVHAALRHMASSARTRLGPRTTAAVRVDGATMDQAVEEHARSARNAAVVVGLGTSVLQATSLVGTAGTLTLPATVFGAATDWGTLRWIQGQMVADLAHLGGVDLDDPDQRAEAIASAFRRTEDEGGADGVLASGGHLIAGWLRRLPGRTVRSLATRTVMLIGAGSVLRLVPFAGVPFVARANARATRELGATVQARYDRDAPAATAAAG